jgi:hypothetical protein
MRQSTNVLAITVALCVVGAAWAQQTPAPAEEPGWAQGPPKDRDRHEDGPRACVPDPDVGGQATD